MLQVDEADMDDSSEEVDAEALKAASRSAERGAYKGVSNVESVALGAGAGVVGAAGAAASAAGAKSAMGAIETDGLPFSASSLLWNPMPLLAFLPLFACLPLLEGPRRSGLA